MLKREILTVRNIFEGLRTSKKSINFKILFAIYRKGTLKLWDAFRTCTDL
jgi:hypothetical protein